MFGGALLAVSVYLIARYLLKFRDSVWDTVALISCGSFDIIHGMLFLRLLLRHSVSFSMGSSVSCNVTGTLSSV